MSSLFTDDENDEDDNGDDILASQILPQLIAKYATVMPHFSPLFSTFHRITFSYLNSKQHVLLLQLERIEAFVCLFGTQDGARGERSPAGGHTHGQ